MTEAEEQQLFARLERLERSNWRWKLLASVLGVVFLLLMSLGVLTVIDTGILERQVRSATQLQTAIEDEQQARMAAEEARREAERARAASEAAGKGAPKRMPREPRPGEAP